MRKLTATERFEKTYKSVLRDFNNFHGEKWWTDEHVRRSFCSVLYSKGRQDGILSVRIFHKKRAKDK